MQLSSKQVVIDILNQHRPQTILDAPCGGGWLKEMISYEAVIDGIDLYAEPIEGYRAVHKCDLNQGLSADLPQYDCVACCEGIEHFGNPLLFFTSAYQRLNDGGIVMVTTPNTWFPESKLRLFLRGFYPDFPPLIGRIEPGAHMHIMPWSFPQLYLYLKLANFSSITLHPEPLSKPRHRWERLLARPQARYCARRQRQAKTDEERDFWKMAGSEGSICGRHLIVTAKKT